MLDRANTNLPTAPPHDQQMDPAIFSTATAAAAKLPNLHAFLVLRNGHLIHEFYAVGNTRESTHQIRSVTKSILSTSYRRVSK